MILADSADRDVAARARAWRNAAHAAVCDLLEPWAHGTVVRATGYPSYFDLNGNTARTFKGGLAWPTTAFYDARGKLTKTHPGAYATQAKLDEDIRRYALGS